VEDLDNRFEVVRDRLDKLIDMDDKKKNGGNMRVFNNGNTVVEVSVKTRKNSGQSSVGGAGGGGAKWDGILQSQDEATQQHRNRKADIHSGLRKKKVGVSSSYAQPTKSSKVKSLHTKRSPKVSASSRATRQGTELQRADSPPANGVQSVSHQQQPRFLARTLRIFLFEMRSALKSIDPQATSDAHKILDDLEFVSENLNFSGGGGASVEGSSSAVAMVNATQPESMAHHDQMIERLKREHLVHQQEARDLKQQLSKINQQFLLYEEESAKKDAKVAECQGVINRLAANNNDMLALLTSKADLEESLHKEQGRTKKLEAQLEAERSKRKQLQTDLVKAQKESFHLAQVVTKLKSNGKGLNEAYAEALASIERPPSSSGGHSSGGSSLPQAGPTGPNPAGSNDITVDIDISDSLVNAGGEEEDERTSRNVSDVEEDDSAIGNSESISAAPAAIPNHPHPPAHNDNLVAPDMPPPRPARHIPGLNRPNPPPPSKERVSPVDNLPPVQRQASAAAGGETLAGRETPETLLTISASKEEESRMSLGQEIMRIQRQSQMMRKAQQMAAAAAASNAPASQEPKTGSSFNALPWEETLNSSEASCGPLEDTSLSAVSEGDKSAMLPPPPSYHEVSAIVSRTRSENNSSGVLERSSVNATGSEAGSGNVDGKGTSRQPAVAQPAATHEKTKAKVAAASEVAAARRQRALDEAAGTQDARVLNFLDRMRNDKKFQISLSNPPSMNAATDGKSFSGGKSKRAGENNSTMNFELSEGESGLAALTESQFRQGLEASLDLPTTDNE